VILIPSPFGRPGIGFVEGVEDESLLDGGFVLGFEETGFGVVADVADDDGGGGRGLLPCSPRSRLSISARRLLKVSPGFSRRSGREG
jgi:hypothetical protein